MHKHDWYPWVPGEFFFGWFSWNARTRFVRECKSCGKIQTMSKPGHWKRKKVSHDKSR